MVAVDLYNMSEEDIEIDFSFTVRNSAGKEVARAGNTARNSSCWGEVDFATRSTIMDALVEGTLTIEVRMRLTTEPKSFVSHQFIPENPLCTNILKMFIDEESADVVFEVGGGRQAKRTRKKAKTSSVNFHAHRLILKKCTDVRPQIFWCVLYYIYGGKLTDDDLQANAKELIDAADKFGIVTLKLEAEACYVESTTISVDNMMDNLLYADSKNCALLKETVMDFIVENGQDVLEKVSLKDVPGGMFADLLTAMTRGKKKDTNTGEDGDELSTMRVSELRKKLDEKGLDIDGSREAMIASLEDNT